MAEFDLDSYAERRNLREATVHRVRGLDEASRAAVLALVVPLALNDNNLRDVLDFLEDIAARRGTAIAAVLESAEIAALRKRDMGRSDRIRELKGCLYRLRYPQLSAALRRIEELRRSLHLPNRVRLELPENLEGDELTVTLRAGSAKQLRELVAATASAFERDEIETIFAVWQESEG
jgi:hypothetical protein